MNGIGLIASNPGDSEEDSGHIATRMIVSVLLNFHDEVHIFTRSTAIFEFSDNRVFIHRYKKPFHHSWWGVRLFGQLIFQLRFSQGVFKRKGNMDLIIISSSGMIIPVITAKLSKLFIIYRVGGFLYAEISRDSELAEVAADLLRGVERAIYYIVDIIFVLSPSMAENEEFGGFRQKTYVWNHYFFDNSSFSITTPYDQREMVIGHIGVSTVKGTLELLEGISQMDTSDVDRVIIVGDGSAMQAAVERADHMSIPIEFTGKVKRDNMEHQFNRMRLLVISSRSEGVPKVAIEAMACGTPVLATRVGGIPDYIEQGVNGFLVDSNEPEELATAIQDALEAIDQGYSTRANNTVEEEFSLEQVASEYRRIIVEENINAR